MAKKKIKQPTSTISFKTRDEQQAAIRKAKMKHASLSHCARDLFSAYQPTSLIK